MRGNTHAGARLVAAHQASCKWST
eukprot:COSAG02_NODE_47363_length_341_cov_2.776860_1_plen_23_part_10